MAISDEGESGRSSGEQGLRLLSKAAGVSHNSPRAQTCTFERPGLQKHHQNSTRRSPRERRKNEISCGRDKEESEILGGPAEGGSSGS